VNEIRYRDEATIRFISVALSPSNQLLCASHQVVFCHEMISLAILCAALCACPLISFLIDRHIGGGSCHFPLDWYHLNQSHFGLLRNKLTPSSIPLSRSRINISSILHLKDTEERQKQGESIPFNRFASTTLNSPLYCTDLRLESAKELQSRRSLNVGGVTLSINHEVEELMWFHSYCPRSHTQCVSTALEHPLYPCVLTFHRRRWNDERYDGRWNDGWL
jgi:hypothetical protein